MKFLPKKCTLIIKTSILPTYWNVHFSLLKIFSSLTLHMVWQYGLTRLKKYEYFCSYATFNFFDWQEHTTPSL